jgi:diphthine-ammonia ligase
LASKARAAISWSGGKDSCAALGRVRERFDVVAMVTMFDEAGCRSRSHGLRPEVLAAQAQRLGLRQVTRCCDWTTYNDQFEDALDELKADGVMHVVFGDILFDDHRRWAEARCAAHGLTAVEPLFGCSTRDLFVDWTASGAGAVIVTVRADRLDASWLGRRLAPDMLAELDRLGVDPCGERGEYHTIVTESPLFRERLALAAGPHVQRSGCWALDMTLAPGAPIETQ